MCYIVHWAMNTITEEPNTTVLELFDELKYFLMQEKLLEMSEDILLPVNH